MSDLMLRDALEDLAASVRPVDFVPRARAGVRRRRRRHIVATTGAVVLVLGGATAAVVYLAGGQGPSHRHSSLDSTVPPGAPPLHSHGQATTTARVAGETFGPPEQPDAAMDYQEAYATAWSIEPIRDASSAFAVLAHMTAAGDIDTDAWLIIYPDHCEPPHGAPLQQRGEPSASVPSCSAQPYTVAIDAQSGEWLGSFSTSSDPRQPLDASDDEQGGVSAVLQRRQFLDWMHEHYPDVPITAGIFNSPYNREWLASQGARLQTQEGWIDGATGRWIAPEGSIYIGDGFHPQPPQVRSCRHHPDQGDCGLRLAIADGNFHPDGGYPEGQGTYYTQEQIQRAVAAAGYTYHVRHPPRCHGELTAKSWSVRDGQPSPADAAVWFAKYASPKRITTQGWTLQEATDRSATLVSGTVTLHAEKGPDDTWQITSGLCR